MHSFCIADKYMHVKIENKHPAQGAFIPERSRVFYTGCAMNAQTLNELFNFTYWDSWRLNRNERAERVIKESYREMKVHCTSRFFITIWLL